jgi:hypothetical protein
MSDPYRKARPGEKLTIPARAWNQLMEGLSTAPGITGDGGGPFVAPYTWVWAKNTTGQDLPRWGVLAITGLESVPGSTDTPATRQFQELPILTGTAPTTSTVAWCIAVDPIPAGTIGRVAVDGVVQCKVEIATTADTFVACKASASELKTGGSGQGMILWKQTGTGTGKWALVRIGGGSGGVRLGTVSTTWVKGETVTVTEQNGDGTAKSPAVTFMAKNYFSNIVVSSTYRVACAQVDGTWILIAAECL